MEDRFILVDQEGLQTGQYILIDLLYNHKWLIDTYTNNKIKLNQ